MHNAKFFLIVFIVFYSITNLYSLNCLSCFQEIGDDVSVCEHCHHPTIKSISPEMSSEQVVALQKAVFKFVLDKKISEYARLSRAGLAMTIVGGALLSISYMYWINFSYYDYDYYGYDSIQDINASSRNDWQDSVKNIVLISSAVSGATLVSVGIVTLVKNRRLKRGIRKIKKKYLSFNGSLNSIGLTYNF